ncbi:MAG: hypothetical protein P1R74_06340 [Sedimenticola sp.]|nr:hypothetical protein [Sedimenticola sp.]
MSVQYSDFSWKALLAGSIFILIFGLVMQLVFVSFAAGQMILAQHFPDWTKLTRAAVYALGLLLFFFTMALGGYITARIATRKIMLHGTLVALLTGGVSFAQSLSVGGLTLFGALFFILGIPFTLVGCWYSIRRLKTTAKQA